MRKRKAVFYFVAGIVSFFLAGAVTGYVTRYLVEHLPVDPNSGVGSAIVAGIGSVVGFLYRKLVIVLLKKAFKAVFEK